MTIARGPFIGHRAAPGLAVAALLSACGARTSVDFGLFPADGAAQSSAGDAATVDVTLPPIDAEPDVEGARDAAVEEAVDERGTRDDGGDAADSSVVDSGDAGDATGEPDAPGDLEDSSDSRDAGDATGSLDAAPEASDDGAVACMVSMPADFANWRPVDYGQDLVDNGDGTVTDNGTGLTWMKYPVGESADGGTEFYPGSLVAAEAACPCPWRLPQRIELLSIIDYSRYDMALSPLFVAPPADSNTAWTATPYQPTGLGWFVDLVEGSPFGALSLPEYGEVRCVRGSTEAPALRYSLQESDAGVSEVVDNGTGLVWMQRSAAGTYTVGSHGTACAAPYRVPTISELLTLVDSVTSSPAIDTAFFPDTGSDGYVSSTEAGYIYLPGYFWYVDFTNGYAFYDDPAGGPYQVRCVR